MAENQPNFIPIIWQSPSAYFEEPSPNYSSRGSLYGVSGIPHAQFGGTVDVVGGGTNMYPYYLNAYNSLVNNPSPLAMSVTMESSGYRDVSIVAEVEVTADVTTTNNKIIFLLTRHISDDYFCSVVYYADEDFNLTTTGQTDTYESSVTMNPLWNMEDLTAVVLVQTMSGNHVILQGASSMFSGILPLFTADRLEGPAGLGVNFHNSSFPQIGIDLFEWDFDN
ncbi:MAG: hypothetical protein JW996_05690, partial [Candidatus Cloacimonetes bacterium]|nr:hypothetical protein [Candidatus Cloacimonadota bacterium]